MSKRDVLKDALILHDPYDQYGWCQGWRFAIAEMLYYWHGHTVEGFAPNPLLSCPDTDAYEWQELEATYRTKEQLLYAYEILTRYRAWLAIAGEDY